MPNTKDDIFIAIGLRVILVLMCIYAIASFVELYFIYLELQAASTVGELSKCGRKI